MNASLYGIDSHGVNLFSHYLDCIDNGRILPNQEPINNISGSRVQCDAGFGLSHYAVQPLLRELSQISDATGISIGSIVNSDHIGAVGIHSANSDLRKIIIGFTNADALASTPDGQTSVLAKPNILFIGIQTTRSCTDMATTIFSMNKVKNYRRNGDLLPSNVARDFEGNFTVDPSNVQRLEPIGGHKGFALAFLVEILTAGISGLDFSAEIMPMYGSPLNEHRQLSHTYIVINPAFSNNHNSDHSDHVWSLIQKVLCTLGLNNVILALVLKK